MGNFFVSFFPALENGVEVERKGSGWIWTPNSLLSFGRNCCFKGWSWIVILLSLARWGCGLA